MLNEPSTELVVRATGEVVDLTDPAQCGLALMSIRDLEGELRMIKQRLTDAIAEEAARQGTKTLELNGDWKAVLSGGTTVEWDAERLMSELEHAGMPRETVAEIVEPVLTYKVDAVRAKRAAAANPNYGIVIHNCRTEVEAPWRVSIRRA